VAICCEGVGDLVGGLVPGEGVGLVVPCIDPGLDGFFELLGGAEGAAAEPFDGEFGEPAFY